VSVDKSIIRQATTKEFVMYKLTKIDATRYLYTLIGELHQLPISVQIKKEGDNWGLWATDRVGQYKTRSEAVANAQQYITKLVG
jgi:hypothetical protein